MQGLQSTTSAPAAIPHGSQSSAGTVHVEKAQSASLHPSTQKEIYAAVDKQIAQFDHMRPMVRIAALSRIAMCLIALPKTPSMKAAWQSDIVRFYYFNAAFRCFRAAAMAGCKKCQDHLIYCAKLGNAEARYQYEMLLKEKLCISEREREGGIEDAPTLIDVDPHACRFA